MPRRPRRHSSGRQRVPMRRMENESNLQVTFSKRRLGIFKKASELVTLCAAELVIILFSPGQKAFSFGHPSVDEIIDRFLSGIRLSPPSWPTNQLMEVQRSPNVDELNEQLTNTLAMLEAESQRGATLDYDMAVSQSIRRLEAPIEELRLDELEQLRAAMENLSVNVGHQIEFLMHQQQENPAAFQPGPSYFGSGGGEGSSSFGGGGAGPSSFGGEAGGAGSSSYGGRGGSAGLSSFGGEVRGSSFIGGFSHPPGPSSFGEGPSHFRSGGALAFFGGASSSGGDGNDLPPFPTRLSPFGGLGGSDIPPEGPSSFGGGGDIGLPPFPPSFFEGGGGSGLSLFPIGPSSFGAGGGALPYPPPLGFFGPTGGGDSPFSMGPSSLSGGGASPFSPWISSSSDGFIFPGELSSFGHGGTGSTTSLPPPPISFGHGVVLPFPHETNSFGLGGGIGDSGSLPIFPLGPRGVTPFPLGPSGSSGGGLPLPPRPSFYGPDSGLPFRPEPGSYEQGGPPYLRPSTSFGHSRSRSRGRGRGRAPFHFDPRAPIPRGPRGRRGRGHGF